MTIQAERWSVPEVPGWHAATSDYFYFLFEPGVVGKSWLAIYNQRYSRTCRYCGAVKEHSGPAEYAEGSTAEEAVKLWHYEAAVAFLAAVKEWNMPKMPERDEQGRFLKAVNED